ncbi:MAG: phosphatase PAP2 family protein [Prevotella sp.]|nr:phosphatase PAP2 family protein [Prevotella sp.]
MMNELALSLYRQLVDLDHQMLLAVNGMHSTYWDTFMWLVSDKYMWIPLYVALVYVIFRNHSLKAFLWCAVAIGVMILFTDAFTASVLKSSFARLRPANTDNPLSAMVHVVNGYRGGRYGFPSNHASNCWGIAFFIVLLFRQKWLSMFMAVWAMTVCYSRMYLGVHYPGDILVGMLLGLVGAWTVYRVFVRLTGVYVETGQKHIYIPLYVGLLTMFCLFAASFFYRI